jgi:hypothetical protein
LGAVSAPTATTRSDARRLARGAAVAARIEFAQPHDRERMLRTAASLERGDDVVHWENWVICCDGSAALGAVEHAREAGQLLEVDAMHMGRYDAGAAVSVAGWSRRGDHLPIGTRVELEGINVASLVFRSGRPARIDGYHAARATANTDQGRPVSLPAATYAHRGGRA